MGGMGWWKGGREGGDSGREVVRKGGGWEQGRNK